MAFFKKKLFFWVSVFDGTSDLNGYKVQSVRAFRSTMNQVELQIWHVGSCVYRLSVQPSRPARGCRHRHPKN